jgi:hypothetical protein
MPDLCFGLIIEEHMKKEFDIFDLILFGVLCTAFAVMITLGFSVESRRQELIRLGVAQYNLTTGAFELKENK